MNIIKKFFNLLGILCTFVLSIVLVAVLIVVPIVSAVSSFTQIDNLKKVVSDIDFGQWKIIDEDDAESEMIVAFVETDLMTDLVELYIGDIFLTLEGNNDEKNLTVASLKAAVNEHMEEIIPIVREVMSEELTLPGGIAMKDEDLEKMIQQMLDENAESLLQSFPSVEDLGISEEVVLALKYLREGLILYAVIGVAAVLSVLILLFRFVRFKGFMWLGIVYLLAAGSTLLEAIGLQKSGGDVMAAYIPESKGLAAPLFSALGTELYKGAGVMAALGVVFILIFVISQKVYTKQVQEDVVEI